MFKYGFIVAGGLGKRLRPLTGAIPKPLLPIGEKPIIQFIIEHMKKYGINNIFVSVNYKKELIKGYLRDGERYGVKIEYIEENEPTGTAGSLALLPENFSEELIISNADLIADVDYRKIHEKLQYFDFVIVAVEREIHVDFGVLEFNENFELVSWREKPIFKFVINGGIYGVSPKIVDFIRRKVPKHTYLDMPELWDMMKKHGMKIGIHLHKGKWHDVGKMEDYLSLNEEEFEI